MTGNDRPDEPIPPEQFRYRLEELEHHNAELEKFNRALTGERDVLNQKLADCSRMLNASTTGLISLDKSGLIEGVNTRAIHMLGADSAYLLKKPISLFIAPEDQAVFYINRSRILAGTQKQPFEIELKKKNGGMWSARIDAQPVKTPDQHLPGMLLAVEDVTAYRQALEALQLKEYVAHLLQSILNDLSAWPVTEIDDIITGSLEKMALAANADRVYVCLLHHRKTLLSVSHEWCGDEIESPAPDLAGVPAETYSRILNQMKRHRTAAVADLDTLAAADRAAHEGFHPPGVQSILLTPLVYGGSLLGLIGCDAVRQPVAWPRETHDMLTCVGSAIVAALFRRQTEKAPAAVRTALFEFVDPTSQTDGSAPTEYEGPIDIVEEDAGAVDRKSPSWRFESLGADQPDPRTTVPLKDGKTATIACQHCSRQQLLDLSEIRTIGTRLKAICACGKAMTIKVELRRELRKVVDLEGVFIRGRRDRLAMQSKDWGKVQISNLSRHGIAFSVFGRQDLRIDDRLRVEFNLDNTAGSVIKKEVLVRSVAQGFVGGQFTGKDPCDVTLGFYLMT